MKNIIIILLILFLIGILWLGTGIRTFSEENYVNYQYTEMSRMSGEDLDLEFLKKEFEPAYEF